MVVVFGDLSADDIYVTSVGGTDLETSGAAGPWGRKRHGLTAAAAFRRTSLRSLLADDYGRRVLINCSDNLSQRPGRFGQCEFQFLRLR